MIPMKHDEVVSRLKDIHIYLQTQNDKTALPNLNQDRPSEKSVKKAHLKNELVEEE